MDTFVIYADFECITPSINESLNKQFYKNKDEGPHTVSNIYPVILAIYLFAHTIINIVNLFKFTEGLMIVIN